MYKVVISSLFFFSYRNKVISFKLWTIWGGPFITAPPIKRGGGPRYGEVRWQRRGWGGSDALVTSPVNFSKWISTYFHQQNWVVCKITKIRNFCKILAPLQTAKWQHCCLFANLFKICWIFAIIFNCFIICDRPQCLKYVTHHLLPENFNHRHSYFLSSKYLFGSHVGAEIVCIIGDQLFSPSNSTVNITLVAKIKCTRK